MKVRSKRASQLGQSQWEMILEAAPTDAPYETQLDAFLKNALEVLGLDTAYLYLTAHGGDRLALEHVRSASAPDADARDFAPRDIMPPGNRSRQARASDPHAPPLEFANGPEHQLPHVARSDIGIFYSAPLQRNGIFLGVLQVGPFGSAQKAESAAGRIGELIQPLTYAVNHAKQLAELRRRLEAAESRATANQRLVSSAFGVNEFMRLLLRLAIQGTGTECGFIATVEPNGARLTIRAQEKLPDGFAEAVDLFPGRGLFDWASKEEPSLVVSDAALAHRYGLRSIVAVPLTAEARFVGVMCVASFSRGQTMPQTALPLLTAFAAQVPHVLSTAPALNRLAQHYLETLRVLVKSADARYPGLTAHSERVSELAATLARRAGLADDQIETARVAGLLHDVGACGIAEESSAFMVEFEHANIGADLIALALPDAVSEAVRAHHEWIDGWGFPNGLTAKRISLPGQVLALSEFVVEESTDWGELRPAMSWAELVAELQQRKGSQFDPDLAQVAIALLSDAGDRTVFVNRA